MTQRDPDTVRHMLPRPVTKEVVSLATESAGMCSTAPSLSYYSEDWGRGWGREWASSLDTGKSVMTLLCDPPERGPWSETSFVPGIVETPEIGEVGGEVGCGVRERHMAWREQREEATGLGDRPDVGRGK